MKTKLQSLLFLGLVMLAAWLPASSFAATVGADSAFGRFMTTVAGSGQQTVNFASNGAATLSTASGNLAAEASGVTQIAGRAVPVAVKRSIGSAAAALAIKNAFPIFMVATTGLAIYDLAIELGYVVNPFGVVTKKDPAICSVAPCYDYGTVNFVTGGRTFGYTSAQAACNAVPAAGTAWSPNYRFVYVGLSGLSCTVALYKKSDGSFVTNSTYPLGQQSISPSAAVYLPSSLQELTDAISSESGWPSTSKLAETVADAVKAGQPLPAGVDTITGPATVAGTTTTTVNNDNSTTTKTEVHNVNYEGNKITVTTTTTLTTVMPDGSTKTSTETKTNEPAPVTEAPITCGLPGTPVCAVKVDETGTEPKVAEKVFDPKADALKSPKEQALERMKGPADTGSLFSGWNVFWNAPPLVACEPFVLPERGGVSMGSIDACNVVDGMRTVMAYIWAVAGLFLCVSMIRETIQGG